MKIAKFETPKEVEDKILRTIEIAKNTGKIKIGTNETTKAIERAHAKLVVIAEDVSPEEVVLHIAPLCDEKKIPYGYVKSRQELGRAAGIDVSTASIAITQEGDAKKDIEQLISTINDMKRGGKTKEK